MQIAPGAMGADLIVGAIERHRDYKGFVCWDAECTRGHPRDHRETLMEAIHTALGFCQSDTRDEWCVLGSAALVYMRGMPGFEQEEAVACGPLVFIGWHQTIRMYTVARGLDLKIGHLEFVVGVRDTACKGAIQNSAFNFAPPKVLDDEGIPVPNDDEGELCYVEEDPEDDEPPPPPPRRRKPQHFIDDHEEE